jgi:hypothetical protein
MELRVTKNDFFGRIYFFIIVLILYAHLQSTNVAEWVTIETMHLVALLEGVETEEHLFYIFFHNCTQSRVALLI